MTAIVVILMVFLALLTVADLLPLLTEPRCSA
jgi:Tfp pilus assembly protein PilX